MDQSLNSNFFEYMRYRKRDWTIKIGGMTKPLVAMIALALAPLSAGAATVVGASYGDAAAGERTFNSTFNSVATQFFDVQTAGTLSSFTMWIDTTSNFFLSGDDLKFSVLGKYTGTPQVSDELATVTLSSADLLAGPIITGGNGDSFVAATWDMSGLGISAAVGEQFGFRLYPTGGQVKFNGTECDSGPGSLPCDASLGLSRFQGSQTSIGSSGSGTFVGTFSLLVDDGVVPDPGVDPVPLPAGLPLLLAGLGVLGFVRRKG